MPPTLLLIHGFPLDATLWSEQVEGLSADARILAPDLRGFGADRRPLPEVMTMEAHAEDLRDLLDEQGVDRVVLCGLSMGGYVAMAFLERWPERVAGLILAHTRASVDDEAGRQARMELVHEVTERGMERLARGMVGGLLTPRTMQRHPELVERVRAMIARQQPEAAAASALGMAQRMDRHATLRKVRVPALILVGEHDRLMPPHTAEPMREAMPHADLVMLPETAHLGCLEFSMGFNGAIHRWLKERITNA